MRSWESFIFGMVQRIAAVGDIPVGVALVAGGVYDRGRGMVGATTLDLLNIQSAKSGTTMSMPSMETRR